LDYCSHVRHVVIVHRRVVGNPHDFCRSQGRSRVAGKRQQTRVTATLNEFRKARLVDRRTTGLQPGDDVAVIIQADYTMAQGCETCSGD
jgi:hypothetical protein